MPKRKPSQRRHPEKTPQQPRDRLAEIRAEIQDVQQPGLTHHNSESGLARKPCLLVKFKLLDHLVATFR